METIVKIWWDEPKHQEWLCAENIQVALEQHCKNTRFKVTELKPINTDLIIEVAEKLYYDINPKSKMDVPSIFYERVENEFKKWSESRVNISFYDHCKQLLKQ